MKFKGPIIIITLIIVMLFTISSVCATDSEMQSIGAHNSTDAVVSAVNDDSLKMNDADEMLAEADDLNEAINGDSSTYVELKKSYNGSYNNGNGIEINRPNVVIDGKGYAINCTGQNSRIFNIQKEGIILKNIIFIGGSSDRGGAIYTNKDLTVINCTFIDNQATGNNHNVDNNPEYGGGAIFADNVKMDIYDCTFINNHANFHGGAIASTGNAPDDWEIFNCTFIDNSANHWGGAFYSNADQNMGNIINSTFIGNRASEGDAVYNYGYEGTIDRCIFINNTANSMICGGSFASMTVKNSIIVNNYGVDLVNVGESIIDNNWWGTTVDDEEPPVVSGSNPNTYYVLDMSLDDDSADITLNNLYDITGTIASSHNKYALPSINLTVKAKNVDVADTVLLGTSGIATIEHAPSRAYVITVGFNGVKLTREVKPSFKWLNEQIHSEGSEISLEQDYIYNSAKDYLLTDGIKFAKNMTIDGQGHIIDAKKSSNIFYFDDDTNSYNLTLKNIIFVNAVGENGAAVYFKGNKIEIINCTFINNKANSEGDAVYVANALSSANKITESVFTENTGSNSVVYLNLDSNAHLKLTNSILVSNDAAYDLKGTPNVILEHNWLGSTDENKDNLSKIKNVTVSNWLFLKIDAVAAMNGGAIISLNNLYNGSEVSTYSEYALHPLTFALGGPNCTVAVPKITLGDGGQANYQFRMDRATATLTASYDNVTTNKELKYSVVDDGSFRALYEIIFLSDDGAVIELTHDYTYFDNDTITEGIVIPRKITINGNGHTIDAKHKTRIFWVPEGGISHVTVNNVNFINAKADYGSVIVINKLSNHFTFSNCNFTDNNATNYGGVVDCVGDYCTIDNCNFVNNGAVNKAAAIRYYHNFEAYIKNSNFINNRVSDGSAGGGVIFVDDGNVNIDNSTFINNVANDRQGSVLYNDKEEYTTTITNSLFLNNNGLEVIYSRSEVKLADSWFGNNATDFDNLSNTVNRASGTWLFLNASVDSSSIPESWPANISFKLYVYNSTSKNVSEYNGDFFDNLDFTITAANGRTDKNIVNLKDIFAYTPLNSGKGSVTAAVENMYCTAQFDVYNREDSNLSIVSKNITYGSNVIIALNYNTSATGKVNITLKGKNNNYAFPEIDLNNTIELEEIVRPDEYNLTVAYSGDAVFSNSTVSINMAVDKLESNISAAFHDINVTDTNGVIFTVILPENATGNLTVKINNDASIIDVVKEGIKANGNLIVDLRSNARPVGKYNLTATYSGDAIYKKSSARAVSNILIIETQISANDKAIDLRVGDESKVNSTLTPNDAIGKITFSSNDSSVVYVNPSTGDIEACGEGSAIISVNFSGCENYTASSDAVTVSVSKVPTEIVIANAEFDLRVKENVTTGASLNPNDVPYNLTYASSDESIVKVKDGKFIALKKGSVIVTVSFEGDNKYAKAESKTINVNVALNDASVTVDNSTLDLSVGDSIQISPKINPSGLKVTYKSSNSSVVAVNEGNIQAIGEGIATIALSVGGDGVYALNSTAIEVRVSKIPTEIIIANESIALRVKGEVDSGASLSPSDAGNLVFNSSDVSIVSVNNGCITAHGAGSAFITVSFAGDNKYTEAESKIINVSVALNDATVSVDNSTLELFVDDVVSISPNTDPSGLKVNYNSSDVSVVSVDNGYIAAHGAGSATITVSVGGDGVYALNSTSVKVTVSKVPTEIIVYNNTLDLKVKDVVGSVASLNVSDDVDLTLTSSNESVVAVNEGSIVGVGEGSAIVTVSFAGDDKYLAAESKRISVTVKGVLSDASVIVNESSLDLIIGQTATIHATTTPQGLNATYKSSDVSVVTVDNGRVVARGAGSATITVSVGGDGVYALNSTTVKVTVSKVPAEIVVYNDTLDLKVREVVGSVAGLNVSGDVDLAFTSSNESVVAVNEGSIVGVGEGSAIVTVSFAGDEKYAKAENKTIHVTVKGVLSDASVIVNESSLDLIIGQTAAIHATTAPESLNVTYKSGDESIAIVNNGIVTAVGAGHAIITVTIVGEGKYVENSTTVDVNVGKMPVEIVVYNDTLDLKVKDVVGSVAGLNVSGDVDLTLTSSNESVATVDNGLIAAVGEGSATITVSFAGNDKYLAAENKTIGVTVRYVLSDASVSVNVSSIDLIIGENITINPITTPEGLNVTYKSSNESVVAVRDGRITAVGTGNATVTITIVGEGKYVENSTYFKVSVDKIPTQITADATLNLYVGNESKISYNLYPADAIGNVTFESSNSGVAYISSAGVVVARSEGSAVITIAFSGSENYAPSNATVKVNVGKIKTPVNASTIAVDKATNTKSPVYTINLPKDATGTLTVTIGTKKYTEKVINGKAIVKAEGLPVGKYDVKIEYSGDDKYAPIVKNTSSVVIDSKVVAKQSSVLYTAKYSVAVYGKDGKAAKNTKVVFYINGKKAMIVRTNYKGVATFNMPSKYLPNKKYTIKAVSLGKSASKKVVVKQILFLKKVKVKKSAKRLVLTAALKKVNGKYLKGKKIIFKFAGKKYIAKTNKKGVAKVTIKSNVLKRLKVGKKLTYRATYLKDTVKKTVKVEK